MSDVVRGYFGSQTEKTYQTDGPSMSEYVTHRELDAKLATVEARTAARFDKIDMTLAQLSTEINSARRESKESAQNLRATIWGTAIGAVGIVLAVLAYGVQSKDSMRDTLLAAKELAASVQAQTAPAPAAPVTPPAPPVVKRTGSSGG